MSERFLRSFLNNAPEPTEEDENCLDNDQPMVVEHEFDDEDVTEFGYQKLRNDKLAASFQPSAEFIHDEKSTSSGGLE